MTKLKRSKGTWTQEKDDEAWVQEIASLVTDFYELFVRMGYMSDSAIAYPPHQIADDVLKRYDFSPLVVKLIKSLPYVEGWPNWNFAASGTEWFCDGAMSDLRKESDLQRSKNPFFATLDEGKGMDEEDGPYIHPEYLVLNDCGSHGSVFVINTLNRHMWVPSFNGGSIDFGISEKSLTQLPNRNTLEGQVPSRLATDVLKDFMSKFESLYWIPGGLYGKPGGKVDDDGKNSGESEWEDDEDGDEDGDEDEWGNENRDEIASEQADESSSIQHENYRRLYLEHGWPSKFNRETFLQARLAWEEEHAAQREAEQAYEDEACYLSWIELAARNPPRARLARLEKEVLTKEYRNQFADPEGWRIHYKREKEAIEKDMLDEDDRLERNLRELAEAREKIKSIDPEVARRRQERIAKYRY